MIWVDKHEKYTGQWENNLQNGYGIHIWYETSSTFRGLRNRYVGEWKKGLREGYGVFFYSDGSRYEGYWENNEKSGFGIYYFKNGTEYRGRFLHDRMMDYNNEGIVAIKTNQENNEENTTVGKKQSIISSSSTIELPKIDNHPKLDSKSSKLEVIIESNNETPMKGGPTPSSKGSDKAVNQFKFNQKKIKSKPSLKPNQPTIPEKENTKVQKEQIKKAEPKKIILPLIKEPRPSVINQPNSNKNSTKNMFANSKNSIYLASNSAIKSNDINHFKSLIDLSDIIETQSSFEQTEKEVENILQRNISEIRKWYFKMLKVDSNDVDNFFNSRAGTLNTNVNLNFEDEIQVNDQGGNPNNENANAHNLLQDDKIGVCLEMKDLWKFFRDYGIISTELTIAQFNRSFFKSEKNLMEMFLIPEELPKKEKYKYIYSLIGKSNKLFDSKQEKYTKKDISKDINKNNIHYNLYYCEDENDFKDLSFNYHNYKHVIVLKQFYEAIVRAAYLKYANEDLSLSQKVEKLISKCRIRNPKDKQHTKSHISKSNLLTSGIMHDGPQQQLNNPLTNEQKQKNAEHILIDTFITTFESLLRPIFLKLYYLQREDCCDEDNRNDITITHRFIYNNLILKSEIMKKYYGTKEHYSELITYYYKEKKLGFFSKKEQFEYYETLFDLEIIFYEFCELVYIMSAKYFSDNGITQEDNSKYEPILDHIWEVIRTNDDFNTIKRIKYAKYSYTYPIMQSHVMIQKNLDEKIEKDHIQLLKRYEKIRYEHERKQMDIEKETNAYVPEVIPEGEDGDFPSEDSDD